MNDSAQSTSPFHSMRLIARHSRSTLLTLSFLLAAVFGVAQIRRLVCMGALLSYRYKRTQTDAHVHKTPSLTFTFCWASVWVSRRLRRSCVVEWNALIAYNGSYYVFDLFSISSAALNTWISMRCTWFARARVCVCACVCMCGAIEYKAIGTCYLFWLGFLNQIWRYFFSSSISTALVVVVVLIMLFLYCCIR